MSFASEFKQFVLRGNVVDLAVGVVIGAAFGTVVTALTKDFITPLVAIPGKAPVDFEHYYFQIGNGKFLYGDFISAVLSFLILALVVFTCVVKPINWLTTRTQSATPEPETTRECPECLSKVPITAKRCAFCTSPLAAA
jgi:large conductance mechanosensitive channel